MFKLSEHIDRLYDSANYIRLKIPLGKEAMIDEVLQTLRKEESKGLLPSTSIQPEVVPVIEVNGRIIGSGKEGEMTALVYSEFVKSRRDPSNGIPILEPAKAIRYADGQALS